MTFDETSLENLFVSFKIYFREIEREKQERTKDLRVYYFSYLLSKMKKTNRTFIIFICIGIFTFI